MSTTGDPLAVLSRIRESKPRPQEDDEERCELCRELLPPEHRHLVDLHTRSLLCACRGCGLLFSSVGAGGDRYRSVPERYVAFDQFELTAAQWDRLQIPVSVAFFFLNSTLERIAAFYPGPAGATESELPLDDWADVVDDNPLLASMQPDVEAFLVRDHRRGGPGSGSGSGSGTECYIVPIDACYELVGHLRLVWRGFDGGTEANQKLDEFFENVRARAR